MRPPLPEPRRVGADAAPPRGCTVGATEGQETRGGPSASVRSAGKRWRRVAFRVLLVVLVLELVYVVGANLYLNSASLQRLVNRRPERFYMSWTEARTWIPGVISLKGVSLSGRSSKDVWYCSLRECAFDVDLVPLLGRRVICETLTASGVDFRLRHPRSGDGSAARPGQPPIPPLLAEPAATNSAITSASWYIGIESVQLQRVDQIWIAGLRVTGSGEITGAVSFLTRGDFEARVDAWRVRRGDVGISGATVSTNAGINLSGRLGPLVFADSRGDQIYNHLDARLEIQGDLIDMGQVGGRVDPSSNIRLGGAGTLDASIQVIGGVYWPGSRLEIHSPQLILTTGSYSWRGPASVIDQIELAPDQRPRARLELEETQLELWHLNTRVDGAIGPRLSLQSIAHDLRLVGRFADADLHMQVSPMRFPDASRLNAYLPRPLSRVFQSGDVLAMVQLQRTPDQGLEGRIELEGDDLAVLLASKEYRVDARLSARFSAGPAAEGRFDLSETTLQLTNVSTPRLSTRSLAPWSATVELYRGDLTLREPWSLQAGVRLSMHDTRPVLAALRSLPDTPGWLRWVPTISNLNGQFDLGASKESLTLHRLALVGRGTDIRAELDWIDEKVLGLIYVRYGLIALGLELLEEDRDWHLLGAKRWYERRTQSSEP
ncbi:MAG: hypothetical protein JNN07_17100 [Verrucomicrobiales bacterium]|nr:hypothetical protein [Verrucomicrobiales bacterium]